MYTPQISTFSDRNQTISDRSEKRSYEQRGVEEKLGVYWGRRKLLISEIQFFTNFWDPATVPKPICVYAGAAPGIHLPFLLTMFPAIRFECYDPAKFKIKEVPDRIILHEEEFTEEIAKSWSGRKDVFFLSDVRFGNYVDVARDYYKTKGVKVDAKGRPIGITRIHRDDQKTIDLRNEEFIWKDMLRQQEWVLSINPVHSLLKFRLPYALHGTDEIKQYLRGNVFWQVWTSQSSETRLVPVRNDKGNYEKGSWSILEYEQWAFYHNSVERELISYVNPFTGVHEPIDYPELLNDYDSVAEAYILNQYLTRCAVEEEFLYDNVKDISRAITNFLNPKIELGKGYKNLSFLRSSLNTGKAKQIAETTQTLLSKAPSIMPTVKGPSVTNAQVDPLPKKVVKTVKIIRKETSTKK